MRSRTVPGPRTSRCRASGLGPSGRCRRVFGAPRSILFTGQRALAPTSLVHGTTYYARLATPRAPSAGSSTPRGRHWCQPGARRRSDRRRSGHWVEPSVARCTPFGSLGEDDETPSCRRHGDPRCSRPSDARLSDELGEAVVPRAFRDRVHDTAVRQAVRAAIEHPAGRRHHLCRPAVFPALIVMEVSAEPRMPADDRREGRVVGLDAERAASSWLGWRTTSCDTRPPNGHGGSRPAPSRTCSPQPPLAAGVGPSGKG